jgi:diguanylate cyclase (GGDEF)-like protein
VNFRFLHRLTIPGIVSQRSVLVTGLISMLAVFILDLLTPAEIRLHVLYVFPLAAIALHAERKGTVFLALTLSVVLQLTVFIHEATPFLPFVTDATVALATSVLTIVLARALRENHYANLTLATRDALTGLHNRRSFDSIIAMEIERQKRYGGVFSLAVLDLDNFKEINDTQGHHVGDRVLQPLADVLRENTRHSDSITRLGGDEFTIMMPNAGEMECSTLCHQLSGKIAARMAEAGFAITASIGHTTFAQAPDSSSDVLIRADKAMYAAKEKGKNCVVSF